MRYFRSFCTIAANMLKCRKIILNPFANARLFMDRTPMACEATLRFGPLRFRARKQDMNPVREVLVSGCYDFILPFLKGISDRPQVLDFGANIGSFALRVLSARPDAMILSVEAARDTHALLAGNARRSGAHWTCVHAALWERNGTIFLQHHGNSETNTVGEGRAGSAEAVPALSYASLMERSPFPKAHVIKMDIEGAESAVVPAAAGELDAEVMIIELHKNISNPMESCKILDKAFAHAYVSEKQLHSKSSPNVVYYLSKRQVSAPGMVHVSLLQHLAEVYDPGDWK